MIKIKDEVNSKDSKNIVTVYEIPTGTSIKLSDIKKQTPIHLGNNIVTNEIAEILAGKMIDEEEYKFSHIYGQWGDPGTFPENGGPYITPLDTNTVADLTSGTFFTTNAEAPIIKKFKDTQEAQAEFTNNVGNYIALISGNDGMSYMGAGLVTLLPGGQKLLAAHVALPGIIKKPSFDLLILWSFIFTNN